MTVPRGAACAFERLVPFSCKGRGFCPSCGGRRMAERAAHLVEHVFPPDVPVRQWVLSVPHRLRYRRRTTRAVRGAGKNGTYSSVTGPFKVAVAFGGAAESTGQCAEHTFLAGECALNGSGTTLKCKAP